MSDEVAAVRTPADAATPSAATRPAAREPWLVALDIDGTLLDFGQPIAPPVIEAIQAVAAAGHHVVLASGRSLVSMVDVFPMLGIASPYMVCSNGAVVVRADDDGLRGWSVEHAVTFDPEPALRRLAEHLPGAIFAVEDVGVGFRLTDLFPDGELDGEHRVVTLEDLWADEVSRVVVRAPKSTTDEFHRAVAELGLAEVEYSIGWSAWLDIAPQGVTKAAGLELVRTRLGVHPSRTMAIGDGHNDIDMLRWAARGVAMGNADDLVKSAADEVTLPLEQHGAARALRTLY